MPGSINFSPNFDQSYTTMEDPGQLSPVSSVSSNQENGLHTRSSSTDSLADRSESSGLHSRQMSMEGFIPTRSTSVSAPKPAYNPLQFIKVGPSKLCKDAEKQLETVEKIKQIKKTSRQEEEDWQSNLDSWKNSRRKRQETVIERVTERKKIEQEEQERTRKKSRTFNEMMENRGVRGRRVSLQVYTADNDDISDLLRTVSPGSSGDKSDQGFATASDDTGSDRGSDHIESTELSSHDADDKDGRRPENGLDSGAEEYTYEKAIQGYLQYAETHNRGFSSSHESSSLARDHRKINGVGDVKIGKRIGEKIAAVSAADKDNNRRTTNVPSSSVKVDVVKRRSVFERTVSADGERISMNRRSLDLSDVVRYGDVTAESDFRCQTATTTTLERNSNFKEKLRNFANLETQSAANVEKVTTTPDRDVNFKKKLANFSSLERNGAVVVPKEEESGLCDAVPSVMVTPTMSDVRRTMAAAGEVKQERIPPATTFVDVRLDGDAAGTVEDVIVRTERPPPTCCLPTSSEITDVVDGVQNIEIDGGRISPESSIDRRNEPVVCIEVTDVDVPSDSRRLLDTVLPSDPQTLEEKQSPNSKLVSSLDQSSVPMPSNPTRNFSRWGDEVSSPPHSSEQRLSEPPAVQEMEIHVTSNSIKANEQMEIPVTCSSDKNQQMELPVISGNKSALKSEADCVVERIEQQILERLESEDIAMLDLSPGGPLLDDDFTLAPSAAEPPKEKPPPPPPMDCESEPEDRQSEQPRLPERRSKSTKSIRKEISKRRSNFLGIEGQVDIIDPDEVTATPPPDLDCILRTERQFEGQQRQKIQQKCTDSSETRKTTTWAEKAKCKEEDGDCHDSEDDISRQEREIIESLEREERLQLMEAERRAGRSKRLEEQRINLEAELERREEESRRFEEELQQQRQAEQDRRFRHHAVSTPNLNVDPPNQPPSHQQLRLTSSYSYTDLRDQRDPRGPLVSHSHENLSSQEPHRQGTDRVPYNQTDGRWRHEPANRQSSQQMAGSDWINRQSFQQMAGDDWINRQQSFQQVAGGEPYYQFSLPRSLPLQEFYTSPGLYTSGDYTDAHAPLSRGDYADAHTPVSRSDPQPPNVSHRSKKPPPPPPGKPQHEAPAGHSSRQSLSSESSSGSQSHQMSRQTFHVLSAAPKPKLTDNESWLSRRKDPQRNNYNRHWLIQEAEQRRITEHQERNYLLKSSHGQRPFPSQTSEKSLPQTNQRPFPSHTSEKALPQTRHKSPPQTSQLPPVRPAAHNRTPGFSDPADYVDSRQLPNNFTQQQHHYNSSSSESEQHTSPPQQQYFSSKPPQNGPAQQQHHGGSPPRPHVNGGQHPYPPYSSHSSVPAAPALSQAEPQTPTNQDRLLSVSGKKKCSHCSEELGRGAAMIIESLRLFYHIQCFKCCVCHTQLGNGTMGADVRVRNNKLHCHNCYSNDEGLKFSKV